LDLKSFNFSFFENQNVRAESLDFCVFEKPKTPSLTQSYFTFQSNLSLKKELYPQDNPNRMTPKGCSPMDDPQRMSSDGWPPKDDPQMMTTLPQTTNSSQVFFAVPSKKLL
jgi:hypothetical protein